MRTLVPTIATNGDTTYGPFELGGENAIFGWNLTELTGGEVSLTLQLFDEDANATYDLLTYTSDETGYFPLSVGPRLAADERTASSLLPDQMTIVVTVSESFVATYGITTSADR